MKIRLTESQYRLLLTEDRISFIKGQMLVDPNDVRRWEETKDKPKKKGPEGEDSQIGRNDLQPILDHNDKPIAFLKGPKKTLKFTESTINAFAEADPSSNKEYVQWMTDVFRNLLNEDVEEAIRFVTEDLDQATEALTIFNCVKNRKKFKNLAPSRQGAPQNVKDIRQYKNVGQLYIVVSAFSCDDSDEEEGESEEGSLSKKGKELFNDIMSYKKAGQAEVWKLSERILVYQPKTMVASCEPLGNLANWCTRATPSGGIDPESGGTRYRQERGSEYFHNYRQRLKPGGALSDYYVIMPLELFQLPNPSSHEWYPLQFHFESNQLKNKSNRDIGDEGINRLISSYPEVANFIRSELGNLSNEEIIGGEGLMDSNYIQYLNKFGGKVEDYVPKENYEKGLKAIEELAKSNKGPINQNKYLKWLMSNTDKANILDYIGDDLENLNFDGINLRQAPDLSRFKNAQYVSLVNCNLDTMPIASQLPPMIENISLQDNQIKNATFEGYESLSNLSVINLMSNPITNIDLVNFESMVRECQGLFRVAFSENINKIKNYKEYFNTLKKLDDEGVTSGGSVLIDPYDRD